MNTADLGIDSEKLNSMEAEKRAEFILQSRVEFLKTHGGTATS
jgi:hypothetical protein